MKKWLIVICTMVFVFAFGITAFASSYPSLSSVDGTYKVVKQMSDGSFRLYVCTDKPYVNGTGPLLYMTGYTQYISSSDLSTWVYSVSTASSATTAASPICGSNFDILYSDGTVFFSKPVVTPLQEETTQQALATFTTTFQANSTTYLTVGVLALSVLLGVSLIPRLIRSLM